MPEVKLDKDQLQLVAAYVYEYIDGKGVVENMDKLKKEWDWNPFNDDLDEFEGPWEEIKNNGRLLGGVVIGAVHCVERVLVGGVELSAADKQKVVVKALDDIIRLPWYAEPFDGPAIAMAVKAAVQAMNTLGWVNQITKDGALFNLRLGDKLEIKYAMEENSIERIEAAKTKVISEYREIG